MRVAHVFPYDPRHLGQTFERWTSSQLERWPLAAVARSALAQTTTVHVIGPRARHAGMVVEHRSLSSGPRLRDWGDDRSLSLERTLRRLGPADVCVIHLNDYRAARLVQRAAAGTRVVLVFHGHGLRGWEGADGLVVLHREAAQAIGAPAERIRVLTPSVDCARFAAATEPPAGPPVLGFVGRLERSKGVFELLHVLARLPEARVEVAGPQIGEPRALLAAAREAGVADRLHLLGELDPDALAERMRGWHALLLPSYSEGLSLTALEACGARLPVAAVEGVLPAELVARPGVAVAPRARYADLVAEVLAAGRPPPADWVLSHEQAGAAWDDLLGSLPPWRPRFRQAFPPLEGLRRLRPLRRLRARLRRRSRPSAPS